MITLLDREPHKGADVGFWVLIRNLSLDQSITGFDPTLTSDDVCRRAAARGIADTSPLKADSQFRVRMSIFGPCEAPIPPAFRPAVRKTNLARSADQRAPTRVGSCRAPFRENVC
jgi:hypothetical protein